MGRVMDNRCQIRKRDGTEGGAAYRRKSKCGK